MNFPGWKVGASSSCGSAAWELVAKADEWKPDLIVVGSHGRNALGRFVLGSVSQRVLAEAHCSVRISRGELTSQILLSESLSALTAPPQVMKHCER